MIIQKKDDYYVIKVYKEGIPDITKIDALVIKDLFRDVFQKLREKYELNGLLEVDVYIDDDYGMIIEVHPIYDGFEEIDVRLHIHLDHLFLVEIDMNEILDYEDVYYYQDKFYSYYKGICDNDVIYQGTDIIINNGIKVC